MVGGERSRLEGRIVGQVDSDDLPSVLALWENQVSRSTGWRVDHVLAGAGDSSSPRRRSSSRSQGVEEGGYEEV